MINTQTNIFNHVLDLTTIAAMPYKSTTVKKKSRTKYDIFSAHEKSFFNTFFKDSTLYLDTDPSTAAAAGSSVDTTATSTLKKAHFGHFSGFRWCNIVADELQLYQDLLKIADIPETSSASITVDNGL